MAIAIIPARGGSKRIPRKNIREFHGKPIIAYSIEAAMQSNCFERVIVSTDDSEIAGVAKQYGAEVPFVRPKEISDDFATTLDVMSHAVSWCENNISQSKYYACIYATAPFIKPEQLVRSSELLEESNSDYVFSATSFGFPIQRAFYINQDDSVEMANAELFETRSQDLREAYHDAGMYYLGRKESFLNKKPFFCNTSRADLIPRYLVQDIDTLEDWRRAELLYSVAQND